MSDGTGAISCFCSGCAQSAEFWRRNKNGKLRAVAGKAHLILRHSRPISAPLGGVGTSRRRRCWLRRIIPLHKLHPPTLLPRVSCLSSATTTMITPTFSFGVARTRTRFSIAFSRHRRPVQTSKLVLSALPGKLLECSHKRQPGIGGEIFEQISL